MHLSAGPNTWDWLAWLTICGFVAYIVAVWLLDKWLYRNSLHKRPEGLPREVWAAARIEWRKRMRDKESD